MAETTLSAAGRRGNSIERLRRSVELLLMTVPRDMVRQGRDEELGPLLAKAFGPDHAPEIERQFRKWMENETPFRGLSVDLAAFPVGCGSDLRQNAS